MSKKKKKDQPLLSVEEWEELQGSRDNANNWVMLLHETAVKTSAALELWENISKDLTQEDIREAYLSLLQAEGNLIILRSRIPKQD